MEGNQIHPGDGGLTNTLTRKQISKADPLFEIIGALEEGAGHLAVAKPNASGEVAADITKVHAALLRASAYLAGKKEAFTPGCVKAAQEMIDSYAQQGFTKENAVSCADNFVAAHIDLTRSIIRRAERKAVSYSQRAYVDKNFLIYLNRLSDLLLCMVGKSAGSLQEPVIKENNVEEIVRKAVQTILPPTAPLVNLQIAKEIAVEIEKKATSMGIRVVVAVVEKGGNLVLLESMNDAYIASVKIAWDKAYTAAALKMPTETVGKMAEKGGDLEGLMPTSENHLSFLGGGIPLKIGTEIAGGLGVSGGSVQQDISLAQFGAKFFERRT